MVQHKLINKILREPWAIKPSLHDSLIESLEASIDGQALDPELLDDDEIELKEGTTAIVPIFGTLSKHCSLYELLQGYADFDAIGLALDAAVYDDTVDSIVLYFNSGGGTCQGTPELADKVREASKVKPVISYTDGMMCSAAYWIGSQANAIYCSPSSELGSIGVRISLVEESERLAKKGIKVNSIAAGKYKLAGNSWSPLDDESRKLFEDEIQYWYGMFTGSVLTTRKLSVDTMQGQSFVGMKSVEAGLSDGVIDSLDELLTMTNDL